jgi:hypothetical protein
MNFSGCAGYLPLHYGTSTLVLEYLDVAGHGEDLNGALFRPIRNNTTGELDKAITPDGIYKLVRAYSAKLGFAIAAHALRATAAPMRSIIRPTSPRCRSGAATPTSPLRGSMIIAARGRKIARHSRLLIKCRR